MQSKNKIKNKICNMVEHGFKSILKYPLYSYATKL